MMNSHEQFGKFSNVTVKGEVGSRVLEFESNTNLEQFIKLVEELRVSKAAISLYDPLYPSPSDPGAYLNYTHEKAVDNRWSMTLGNHGWTGGIYQIDDETIAIQIFNLWSRGLLENLDIDTGQIFFHYEQKSEAKNIEEICDLRALHRRA